MDMLPETPVLIPELVKKCKVIFLLREINNVCNGIQTLDHNPKALVLPTGVGHYKVLVTFLVIERIIVNYILIKIQLQRLIIFVNLLT